MKILSGYVVLCIAVLGEARMNVLFLVADDMRPQLGAYSGSNFPSSVSPAMYTPYIDALASKSLLLERAYVQQALCSPSRASFLTSRRPDTTHVYDLNTYFRTAGGNFTTIPQYFKENGYTTVGMGKIFHPGTASGDDDPISWTETYFQGVANFESTQKIWNAIPESRLASKPLRDRQIADHAIEMLRKVAPSARTGDQNFFLAVGFHKPHEPFVFPESFLDYYPEGDIKLPDNPYAPVNMPDVAWSSYDNIRDFRDIKALGVTGDINTTLPDSVTKELRRAYFSAVTWVDSLIGEVVSEIDSLGLSDSTIISFIGDHGWMLGEHGEWGKKTNFELATHAPLMIHIPGRTDGGIKSDQLVEFVDIFPTIAEASGLGQLPLCPEDSSNVLLCREGTSLLPLLDSPNIPLRTAAFSQYPSTGRVMGYSIRTDQYRYTEWPIFRYDPEYTPNWNQLSGVELYDHETDPDENYNVADEVSYKTIREVLSTQLQAGWRNAVVNPVDRRTIQMERLSRLLTQLTT